MALNYPANQDTTIESWTITNNAAQLSYFGKIYGIGELVPVNYNQILTELIALTIPYAPLRDFIFIEKQWTRAQIINEQGDLKQSNALATAMLQLYDYWENKVLYVFDYPLGIVTAMTTEVVQDNEVAPTVAQFHLVITLKVQWFQIPQ
jgi:hypothetical protein